MKAATPVLNGLAFRSSQPCVRCSFRISQQKPFSSSTSRRAVMGRAQMPKSVASSVPSSGMQSQQMRMKEMAGSQFPTDIGLLPYTFVSPPLRELYQMYKHDKRLLLSVLWFKVKKVVRGPVGLIYILKFTKRKDRLTGKKLKSPPLELSTRVEAARQLHFKLNHAIADRELGSIREFACNGLSADIKASIDAQRAKLPQRSNVRPIWELVRYNGVVPPKWLPWPLSSMIPNRAIKVIIDTIVPLPMGGKEATVRQTIVQIRSRQSLDKQDGQGPQIKDLTEYVVVQKMAADGVNKDWMIWGTVLPSTPQQITEIFEHEASNSGGGFFDRLRNMMPSGMGGGGGQMT